MATRLRTAREEAGLSIEDLSARTKIKPAMLLALERGAFEQLPGEFFARAFLRTYARELHLPVADVMAEYEHASAPVDVPLPPTSAATLDPPRGTIHLTDDPSWRKTWPIVAFGAVVVISLLTLNRATDERSGEPGVVGTSGAAPAGSVTEPAVRQRPSASDALTIEIRPIRPVWVTGTADGERVLFRLLEPGERITLQARERLSFRIGDAGAFEFSLNGSQARTIGRDGEVRAFSITRENMAALTR